MKLLVTTLAVAFSMQSFAWGPNGHRIVGEIASKHLNAKAQKEVKRILGTETLAQVAVWADFIKSDPNWRHANPWHYVSIPDGKTYKSIDKNKKGDVVSAIEKFTKVLANKKASKKERNEALKFLVHLVGDIHQPLHVGHAHDRGGNSVEVEWFGEDSNLHKVWDEDLIEMQKLSFTEYTNFINHASKKDITSWQKDGIQVWVKESMSLREQVYEIVKNKKKYGKYKEYTYNFVNINDLNKRLLQAGIRLAGILNKSL